MTVSGSGDGHLPLDVIPGLANGTKLLGIVVRDLHPVLLLEGHDQLNEVERIGLQVLRKGGFRGHLLDVDAKLLRYDAAELVEIRFGHRSLLLVFGVQRTALVPNSVYTIANRQARVREYLGKLARNVSRQVALGYGSNVTSRKTRT